MRIWLWRFGELIRCCLGKKGGMDNGVGDIFLGVVNG